MTGHRAYGFENAEPMLTLLTRNRGMAFRVDEPIIYHTKAGGAIVVPVGFVSDLTTLFPEGRWSIASILHDWLYRANGMSRTMADAIYREAMQSLGVTWRKRWMIWLGVRLGGWWKWNEYRMEDNQKE